MVGPQADRLLDRTAEEIDERHRESALTSLAPCRGIPSP